MQVLSDGRVRRTEPEWRAIVSRFESSGLWEAAFCRKANVSRKSFRIWRERLTAAGTSPRVLATRKPRPAPTGFIEWVAPIPSPTTGEQPRAGIEFELALPGGSSRYDRLFHLVGVLLQVPGDNPSLRAAPPPRRPSIRTVYSRKIDGASASTEFRIPQSLVWIRQPSMPKTPRNRGNLVVGSHPDRLVSGRADSMAAAGRSRNPTWRFGSDHPSTHPTIQLGNGDNLEPGRYSSPESAVSGSDAPEHPAQNPAESREFLELALAERRISLPQQTEWRRRESIANPSLHRIP